MSELPIVLVSQRLDKIENRNEVRDALDQVMAEFLFAVGVFPVPVPNSLPDWATLQALTRSVHPVGIVLTGGNNIGSYPSRDRTETLLLELARNQRLPVLGICRGMQFMAVHSGASLRSINGHVRKRHYLRLASEQGHWPSEVNSFHRQALNKCPPEYRVCAWAEDGSIEAIRHETLPWEGWMWHPERTAPFNFVDISRVRQMFNIT